MHILMLAAENGALRGGKVGGMGDVVRDVPQAIAALGHQVTVLTPAYGEFHRQSGTVRLGEVRARFRGLVSTLELYELPHVSGESGVTQYLLEHPDFSACGRGRIYCDDSSDRPFATDASKFALFCAGVAAGLMDGQLGQPDVIHLHDWHMAILAVLLRCSPGFHTLRGMPLVYTIHNLSLQGIRPIQGDPSALKSWFPELAVTHSSLQDPRYKECWNPVRAAIGLCNKVHAVSPTYTREICDPDSPSGAGLQPDLRAAQAAGRLEGILNGCEYPESGPDKPGFEALICAARDAVAGWLGSRPVVAGADLIALRTLDRWIEVGRARPAILVTSVGRLTDQKLGLLAWRLPDSRSCLDHLLDALEQDGLLIILGNGSPELESFVGEVAARRENLLFLRGFSETLADQLYAAGDLFLMPSTFEPCGISQMLAMRAGQPCLVNDVGGLADTVRDAVTGFMFRGENPDSRVKALVLRFQAALQLIRNSPQEFELIRRAAAAARFTWSNVASAYVTRLYAPELEQVANAVSATPPAVAADSRNVPQNAPQIAATPE